MLELGVRLAALAVIPFLEGFNQNHGSRLRRLWPFSFLLLAKASFRRAEMKMAPFRAMVLIGGERGSRTLDTLAGITVFETAPIGHSGISPVGNRLNEKRTGETYSSVRLNGSPGRNRTCIFRIGI